MLCTTTIRHEARQLEIGVGAHPEHTADLLRKCADEIDRLRPLARNWVTHLEQRFEESDDGGLYHDWQDALKQMNDDNVIVLQASSGGSAEFKHGIVYRDEPLPRWKRVLMVIPYFRRRFTPIVAVWQADEGET